MSDSALVLMLRRADENSTGDMVRADASLSAHSGLERFVSWCMPAPAASAPKVKPVGTASRTYMPVQSNWVWHMALLYHQGPLTWWHAYAQHRLSLESWSMSPDASAVKALPHPDAQCTYNAQSSRCQRLNTASSLLLCSGILVLIR